jgi:DNA-binding transcriptional regulator GbsR (MarR family)
MEPKEQVLGAMTSAGKAMSAGQVAEATGLDRKVVDKAMSELKKSEEIVSPKKCYWQPA